MCENPKSTLSMSCVTTPNEFPGAAAKMPRALMAALGALRNLLTSAETSEMFGWTEPSGGLYGTSTSAQRVVVIVKRHGDGLFNIQYDGRFPAPGV